MKNKGKSVFRIIIGVAVACMEESRPKLGEATPELVCEYVAGVLETVFSGTGIGVHVRPLVYPASCKFPVIITLDGLGDLLYWYYPGTDASSVADELAGVLRDVAERAERIPA